MKLIQMLSFYYNSKKVCKKLEVLNGVYGSLNFWNE